MARDLAVPLVRGGEREGEQGRIERSPSPDRVQYSSSEESGEELRGEEEGEEAEALYLEFLNHRIEEERLLQGVGGREEGEVGREQREAEICSTQMQRQERVTQHGARVRSEGRVRRGGREEGVREGGGREEMREDLITLAERFSRSDSREVVRRRAEEVELDTMTQVRLITSSKTRSSFPKEFSLTCEG